VIGKIANPWPAGVEESIKIYKLLEGIKTQFPSIYHGLHLLIALRANDKPGVDDALKAYTPIQRRASSEKGRPSMSSNELATPLHLAVQCATTPMVEYVISKRAVDLSAKNRQGNTALHLAAMQGRDDVVEMLLQEPDIDDSITNHEAKQVRPISCNSNLCSPLKSQRHLTLP
jgi:ankyrin repeat protein